MEKLKGKYEIILGFVTLVLSFSAFKDDIKQITLDLGYTDIKLATVFFWCIILFSISIYFYVLEIALRDTVVGGWKIFDWLINLGFYLFCTVLFSPIVISVNILVSYIIGSITLKFNTNTKFDDVGSLLFTIASILISINISWQIRKIKKEKLKEERTILEIDRLERAKSLINDGYYHHAIFEIFTVLVSSLSRRLENKGHRISAHRIDQLLKAGLDENLIDTNDAKYINELRVQKNQVAHSLHTDFDVSDATQAMVKVSQILQKI